MARGSAQREYGKAEVSPRRYCLHPLSASRAPTTGRSRVTVWPAGFRPPPAVLVLETCAHGTVCAVATALHALPSSNKIPPHHGEEVVYLFCIFTIPTADEIDTESEHLSFQRGQEAWLAGFEKWWGRKQRSSFSSQNYEESSIVC